MVTFHQDIIPQKHVPLNLKGLLRIVYDILEAQKPHPVFLRFGGHTQMIHQHMSTRVQMKIE